MLLKTNEFCSHEGEFKITGGPISFFFFKSLLNVCESILLFSQLSAELV